MKTIEEIIREYSPEVKNIANKFFLPDGSIDDLFQEGLIGLIEGYNSYDKTRGEIGCENFKSFVLMCAKRQIIDAVKKSNSKHNLPMNNFVSLSNGDFVEPMAVCDESLEERVINKISSETDNKLMVFKLSEFERSVLDLYLNGFKQSEIAEKLNKSTKTIDNSLQRIKNKIKKGN